MALAAQAEDYKKSPTHNKIFARLSDADKKAAEAEHKKLFDQYSDAAIEQKLTPVFTGNLQSKKQRPIKVVPPEYPGSMLNQGKTGFVDTIYSIDKYGITRDHIVTYASSVAFERAALAALRQFQYEPMRVNNKQVVVNGVKNRFTFEINGNEYNKKKLTKIINEKRERAKTGSDQDKLGFAYFLEAIPSIVKDYELTDNPNEWYASAANQGSGSASYFLGRNILYGDMCTQDTLQSMGWLLKAAKANITDAQYMLAIESFSGSRFEKNDEKGFYWLKRAASLSVAAKIRHAWILATHPDPKFRDGALATEELKTIPDDYTDKQSYYQTQAAVAAENNDFKQAVKWQKEALEDAQNLKLPLQVLEQQLASYSVQKPWREEI
jgi:TPR repeat protein